MDWDELYECGIHPDQVITVDQCGIKALNRRSAHSRKAPVFPTHSTPRRKINEVILFFVLGTRKAECCKTRVSRSLNVSHVRAVSDLYSLRVHKNDRLAHLQMREACYGYMHDTTHERNGYPSFVGGVAAAAVYAETSRRADTVLILHPIRQPNNAKDVQINKIIMMGTRYKRESLFAWALSAGVMHE
jgi:hypothetical protein